MDDEYTRVPTTPVTPPADKAADTAAPPLRERAVRGAQLALLSALAAWLSYVTSALVGFHEGYWAAISAVVVIQGDLTSTRTSARDRFIGTAIGGLLGWLCALCWRQYIAVYALATAMTIYVCWLFNLVGAGRVAAITVAVIVLIPRADPVWQIALFRVAEVAWGIAVAISIYTAAMRLLWPSRDAA